MKLAINLHSVLVERLHEHGSVRSTAGCPLRGRKTETLPGVADLSNSGEVGATAHVPIELNSVLPSEVMSRCRRPNDA